MRSEGITIILPVYNEEKTIHSTIEQVKSVILSTRLEHKIIVVNDGSTDSTRDILEKEKGILLINNANNLGYGASLKKGIKAARFPWILMVDADGTYPISEIPNLTKYRDNYDMVIGARLGKRVHIPFTRKPAKFILTKIAQFLTRSKIPDLNSGMRLFKKDIAIEFFNLFPSGFSFTTTITLACLTNDYTVKFVPINYFKREGKSTINPIRDFIGFLILIFRVIMYFNPLRFFLLPSILLILLGIGFGVYQIMVFPLGLGQVSIILILGGFQIGFLGILADLIVKNRR